jgi:UDP-2,3-diacylglucosamine pyrophosphatase LpxH
MGPYWSHAFHKFKISKHKLDSAQNITVSKDQMHIGHCCTGQFLLFIHGTTIVSMTAFVPRTSSGTILELCFLCNSKFQKQKLDSALNVTVLKDQVHKRKALLN